MNQQKGQTTLEMIPYVTIFVSKVRPMVFGAE